MDNHRRFSNRGILWNLLSIFTFAAKSMDKRVIPRFEGLDLAELTQVRHASNFEPLPNGRGSVKEWS